MSNAPFPIDPDLTAIAIAYRNKHMIADRVLPRVPVSKQEYQYSEYNLADAFTIPKTTVGRTSAPNQVEFSSKRIDASTKDNGLDSPVPNADINNQPEGYNLLGRTTERVTDIIELDREVRVSKLVFNKSSYNTTNVKTLAGPQQWSDPASKPIKDITTALDKVIMRPNVGIFGRPTATLLRQNPSIVKAYNGSLGDDGLVPLEFLKELFELDEILIGTAQVSITKPGKTPILAATWGPHASFIYQDRLADTYGGVTFGITAEWGTRISGSIIDHDIGLRGGVRVRVGESVDENIIAKDVGCFFENAVAIS